MPSTLLLARLYNTDGKALTLQSCDVYDRDTRQTVEEFIAKMEAHKSAMDAFLTGGKTDNGVIDRLSELLELIYQNRDAIDELTGSAFDNQDVLRKLGETLTGKLTYDGNIITGETGIAFGTTIANANSYTGKIKIILEEITV